MPVMDGYQATLEINEALAAFNKRRELRGRQALQVPIVALTANDTPDERRKC